MNPNAATNAFLGAQIKQSPPLVGTESAANAIERVKYTHDAMIDLMIGNPSISQNELAKHFGYTVPWVSRIVNSDAFLARLAQRKADLVDPSIALNVEEKLRAIASRSADIVLEKLEQVPTLANAMEALSMTTKALGFGARQQNVAVQQNFIVPMPGKAASAQEWAEAHQPQLGAGQPTQAIQSAQIVDVDAKEL